MTHTRTIVLPAVRGFAENVILTALRPRLWLVAALAVLLFGGADVVVADSGAPITKDGLSSTFNTGIRPLLAKYCFSCHSTKVKKGELDLQRFSSLKAIRKDVKPWQLLIEQLEAGEMPPKGKPQPTASQRKALVDWTRRFLRAEALARAGDPGRVPLRRLSNAEYDNTVRDLTGFDLLPAREFPADGAAGEGFTNAAESLSMSPTMMAKYLAASKKIASHVVLLPNGFRFSAKNTRRDWTDESLAELRSFYRQFTNDGRLPLRRYLTALVRHRTKLLAGQATLLRVARTEKLSPVYLGVLWKALNGERRSFPLDRIRARWKNAAERDVPAIVAEVNAWREPLWSFVKIGSYRYGATVRQVAKNPSVGAGRLFQVRPKLVPVRNDVVLYLVARDFVGNGKGHVIWKRPRFEAAGQPALLLSEYDKYGSKYEFDYSALFGRSDRYLSAVMDAAHNRKTTIRVLAAKHKVDESLLKRWIDLLALGPSAKSDEPGRVVAKVDLTLFNEKAAQIDGRPAINGWKPKGAGLPVLVSNSSDKTENIPGRASPHKITVHPTPQRFVAVVWNSPIAGKVRVAAKIAHAHNACGNGVAWWVESQTKKRSAVLSEGAVDRGKTGSSKPFDLTVQRGDRLFLAVEARDRSHVCDLTEISFRITELAKPNRKWDLASDVADNVLSGNPHSDRLGNKAVWHFAHGAIAARSQKSGGVIPPGSLLARWRKAATDPAGRKAAEKLAARIKTLLSGQRPQQPRKPDRVLFDKLVSLNGPLLRGFDVARLHRLSRGNNAPRSSTYGLKRSEFKNGDLVARINKVIKLRLPAALFRNREFRVEATIGTSSPDRAVQFQVLTAPPAKVGIGWDAKSPLIGKPDGSGHKRLLAELAEFRKLFPPFICYPHVIPLDEVVCLKTFHREDEPLKRLFLNEQQKNDIDRLWAEHRFITKFPMTENEYLPLFIGFVTQDQPKKLLDYFNSRRGWFRKRAETFQREFASAAAKQMRQLFEFAGRAYRRPLAKAERDNLQTLYAALRRKKMSHEDAFRNVVARVLISPSFLLHLEKSPPGKKPGRVSDWELAARLSYFLWGSLPDAELRRAAAAGRLRDPKALATQVRRMLKDARVRGLAIEFGTQWMHVRNFDSFNDKNERLFPTFNAKLRGAMYEESILFFQDLFQNNRPLTDLLNSDATYLNETLAKHYAIPGVTGDKFRRVTGVRKYGRGGILGLASVQAKQAGASRTSPVLRGNWVVETLLGERLPRPPANVPKLPESELDNNGLTMRQLVEKHTKVASCAACHQRIDPFGFAFERYDPIGRRRKKDLGGLAVDANVTLKDGTKFTGLDGLRTYLLTKKKRVITRLFCRRLLGYALGRSATLSDEPLLDEIVKGMKNNDGRTEIIVLAIVRSPQFRMIRGRDYAKD